MTVLPTLFSNLRQRLPLRGNARLRLRPRQRVTLEALEHRILLSTVDTSLDLAMHEDETVTGPVLVGAQGTEPNGLPATVEVPDALVAGSANLQTDSFSAVADSQVLSLTENDAALYSIGTFASAATMAVGGQSFTPDVTGPDGNGVPESAATVSLKTISVGYATSTITTRSEYCWVYSSMLNGQEEVGQSEGLVATSVDFTDGSVFGNNSFSRTYIFSSETLNTNQQYYFYFSCEQSLRCKNPSTYSGGTTWDADFCDVPYDIQFQVVMSA